jgi:DNA invertase Pin-like site-specific DNA recombinase
MSALIRAVAYYRASTPKQEASIEEQREFARSSCPREKIQLVREFEDFGLAGDEIARRSGLQALFVFCEEQQRAGRPIAAIVLWDHDRLSRADSIKTAVCIDRLIEAGVTRAFSTEGWLDWTDDLDRVMTNLRQDFGRRGYSKSLSKNVARSCIDRVKQGLWPGGRRPYGYTLGPDGHLTKDEAVKAEAVIWMFTHYATRDTSSTEIARELTRRSVPPPDYYGSREKPEAAKSTRFQVGRWTRCTVNAILTNPIYTGTLYYGRTHTGKYHRVRNSEVKPCKAVRTARGALKVERNPVEEQIITPKAHPALVDEATFRLVQQKLRANKPGFKPGTTRRTFKWVFGNGMLRCGHCGSVMHGQTPYRVKNGKRYEWKVYACSKYLTQGKAACGHNAIHEADLLRMVTEAISDHFSDPHLVNLLREQVAQKEKAERMEAEGRAVLLRRRIAELKDWVKDGSGRLAKVPEDMLPGLIAEIRSWKAELEAAVEELRGVEQRDYEQQKCEALIDRALNQLQKLPKLIRQDDQAMVREILRSLIQHIELFFKSREVKERRRYVFSHGWVRMTEAARLFGMDDIRLPMSEK